MYNVFSHFLPGKVRCLFVSLLPKVEANTARCWPRFPVKWTFLLEINELVRDACFEAMHQQGKILQLHLCQIHLETCRHEFQSISINASSLPSLISINGPMEKRKFLLGDHSVTVGHCDRHSPTVYNHKCFPSLVSNPHTFIHVEAFSSLAFLPGCPK